MSSPPLTLTSLLNSLHSHLQSQTQLLPTLHLQLGLPPSALEDELQVIQQQLIERVEARIEVRRKEVGAWLEKCDGIEKECLLYAKALGGNAKSAGSSVGELMKEQMLPRRFELVSAHQEKLRQTYHTKLEQLTSLTTRLQNLSRTLGPGFYPPDILGSTIRVGEIISQHRDVTPERFSKLEKELVRGKSEITKRQSQLQMTFLHIDYLYAELGIAPPPPDSFSPLDRPRSISSSSSTMDPFLSSSLSTPTPCPRKATPSLLAVTPDEPASSGLSDLECRQIFGKFVARIEELDESRLGEGSTAGLVGVDPCPELLRWSERTRTELETVKRKREAHIQAMYDQLEALWRRLGVSEADMDSFVEAHRGSTEETVQAYEDELERMLELKRERMGVFIGNAREEIIKHWDDLLVGEEERLDFAPFADDEHTEELLCIHEAEITRLKEERRKKGPLLASIKKYFEICDEEKELAIAASDQGRLLGRGVRGDPGRLLREEKMRKRVNKEKPRLEQDLLATIPAWEEANGCPFLVYGERILQMLMETASAAEQENAGSKRKTGSTRSASIRSATPQYVPGPSAGASAPPARPSTSMSNKRPRLGDSASSTSKPASSNGAAPLGSSRAHGNVPRPTSPGKGKKGSGLSSLPRPVTVNPTGNLTSVSGIGFRATSNVPAVSGATSRYGGGSLANSHAVAKKATRAKRESFKPRHSDDASSPSPWLLGVTTRGHGGRWGSVVKQECRS